MFETICKIWNMWTTIRDDTIQFNTIILYIETAILISDNM